MLVLFLLVHFLSILVPTLPEGQEYNLAPDEL